MIKYDEYNKTLFVFKGFDMDFYNSLPIKSLIDSDINNKFNILNINSSICDNIYNNFLVFNENKYLTYEEFLIVINTLGEQFITFLSKNLNINIVLINNNFYINYYKRKYKNSEIHYIKKLISDITLMEDTNTDDIIEIEYLTKVIGDIKIINNNFYCSYKDCSYTLFTEVKDYYSINSESKIYMYDDKSNTNIDVKIELNNSEDSYISIVEILTLNKNKYIELNYNDDLTLNKYIDNLKLVTSYTSNVVYTKKNHIDLKKVDDKFKKILKDTWGYEDFKEISMYKSPEESHELIKISQGQIIQDIVTQCENAYNDKPFKDIFITAPTGSGKSVIFQIPALYLAEKYKTMTLIVSPLISLMNDQVFNIKDKGISNVAYLNSGLSLLERQLIIENIKSGEIDILYLSPELLLSNNIKNLISSRKIGLFIIDESHIVSTWGKGFRPDYWYLGDYIKNIRKYNFNFPICSFTATAVHGGNDDMCNDIIETLNMNAVKYIGCIKREDILFDIKSNSNKLAFERYTQNKTHDVLKKIITNIKTKTKTIIYFPFATTANEVYSDVRLQPYLNYISLYTGKIDNNLKNDAFENFKSGKSIVLLSTKAFGMGVDITDIKEVYHYAPTGTLSDYIQEIGRVAREQNMTGTASIDFYPNDFKYVKQLNSLSKISQYQLKLVLKKIYELIELKQSDKFLVNVQDFASIFPGDSVDFEALERKIKIALLLLEKDLRAKYNFPVIITKPKSLLSHTYVCVNKDIEYNLLKSKYNKYFEKIHETNFNNQSNDGLVTYSFGDIFKLDLKSLWEDNFSDYTFNEFRHSLFVTKNIDFPFKNEIYKRYRISIHSLNKKNLIDVKSELINNINIINSILDSYIKSGKAFSLLEFENDINKIYNNKLKSKKIANNYFKLIKPLESQALFKNKYYDFNSLTNKYTLLNKGYQKTSMDLITKSGLTSKIFINDFSINLFYSNSSKTDFDNFRVLYLLELFDLVNYTISGGENPEILIKVSDPEKIRRLSSTEDKYTNNLLKHMNTKNENSIEIMNYFFTKNMSNEERWDFIERYFLGEEFLIN